ncbi:Beta-1,4-mannosyl-glycoprotein 4-beta-N-acetylglucosaminyltransferase, partial [Stegodyphus mimosarum]
MKEQHLESEETCAMHFSSLTRHGKKIFLILVAVNIVIWFIYYRSNNSSHFEFHSKEGTVKKLHSSLRNVSLFHIPLLNVKDMASLYIDVNTNIWCFLEGSDITESRKRKNCICIKEWYGLDCGIPASVWKSSFLQEGKNAGIEIRRRKNPRRIIISLVVEDLFDLLDINIQNLFSVVDLFLLIEE